MKILVTGGAGFIGSAVVTKLLERGEDVVIVDNLCDYYDVSLKKNRIELNKSAKFIQADVSDISKMDEIFSLEKFDKVCHLAAQAGVRYSIENPLAYEKANGLGHLVILEMCRKYNVKNLVYASSSSVYGGNIKIPFKEDDNVDNPVSLYAATKKYNELQSAAYSKLYGINTTGLRFFTVYGPWGRPDMALFIFVKNIIKGKPIKIYNNGNMYRDFTYISDIVSGVILAIDNCKGCEIFNLGRGEQVNLLDFIKTIEEELGIPAKKEFLPMQKGDVYQTYSSTKKAEKILNYKPKVSIKEGIKKFVAWYKEYYGK